VAPARVLDAGPAAVPVEALAVEASDVAAAVEVEVEYRCRW
jgi:hypothetical protein